MGKEIAVQNGRISDFHGLVTLTLDRVILHTVMHHSIELYLHTRFHWNQRNFLWSDGRTYGGTFETHCIRSTRKSGPNNSLVGIHAVGLRFEPLLLSTSCTTAHSARVLWPLGYTGRTFYHITNYWNFSFSSCCVWSSLGLFDSCFVSYVATPGNRSFMLYHCCFKNYFCIKA